MENSTREIMQNSKLSLEDTDFNKIVMNKILLESHRRKKSYQTVLYLLVFVCADAFIFFMFTLLNILANNGSIESNSILKGISIYLNPLKGLHLESNYLLQFSITAFAVIILIPKKNILGFLTSGKPNSKTI